MNILSNLTGEEFSEFEEEFSERFKLNLEVVPFVNLASKEGKNVSAYLEQSIFYCLKETFDQIKFGK